MLSACFRSAPIRIGTFRSYGHTGGVLNRRCSEDVGILPDKRVAVVASGSSIAS
jgi:hypothetical protein